MTMDYLVTCVLDEGEGKIEAWYDFVWNRTRAIRKVFIQYSLRISYKILVFFQYFFSKLLNHLVFSQYTFISILSEYSCILSVNFLVFSQDITLQHLCSKGCVELTEKCARFHIMCSYLLCEEEMTVFDQNMNHENLTKCLISLKQFYRDLRVEQVMCTCLFVCLFILV